jgi:hypothetical protein
MINWVVEVLTVEEVVAIAEVHEPRAPRSVSVGSGRPAEAGLRGPKSGVDARSR